ncbi:hypothetical protein KD625_002967 [Salmonella enterica subsp. enterica serovar Bonariensis]|nr:hypothetical protein [Salmonella enterica subsp. enterica serovar Bonariensis]
MAALTDFLPYIRSNISGPLNIMMTDTVLRASVTFCRESLYCRRTVTLVPEAGERYSLTGPDEAVVCTRVIRMMTPDRELYTGQDVEVQRDNSLCFKDAHSLVSVLFAVVPRANVTAVPDELLDFPDTVADGALALLFMQDKKPWYDPQRAQYFRQKFVDGFRRAYREALDRNPISPFRNPVRRQRFY